MDNSSRETMNSDPQPRSIALVTQGFFTAGGVQAVARWLRGQLESSGYRVTVLNVEASRKSKLARSIMRPGTWLRSPRLVRSSADGDVIDVGTNLSELEFMRYLPQRNLTRLLDGFDLIQIVSGGPALGLIASRSRRPIVMQMATLVAWERVSILEAARPERKLVAGLMTKLVSLLEVPAMRRADMVLVENSQVYDALQRKSGISVKFAPPGVDTSFFRPGPQCAEQSDKPLVYLGRLGEPRKGIERLVRGYLDAAAEDSSFPDLILAGRGSLPRNIIKMIDESEYSSRVSVLHDLTEDEKLGLLQRSGFFVQASFEEGLGIALLEAMACGLPTIATETAGTLETVTPGVTGVLVPQNSFDGATLVKAVAEIRADYRRHSLGAREAAVQQFSNEATYLSFERVYEQLMGQCG